MGGILRIEPMTKESCLGFLDDLIAVSEDVSNWCRAEFLVDLPDKWNLSFTACKRRQFNRVFNSFSPISRLGSHSPMHGKKGI